MTHDDLVLNVEAALLSAGRPVALDELVAMFEGRKDVPDRSAVREAVATLTECWRGRALELSEVASGYRAQIRKEYSESIAALWQERPARYSRALLETLALIAYRQPVSRGEIEEVRGVTVSSSIMKTLLEREWVRVVGHRETPGRPALYGTTKQFLDTFNLKNLEALPPLAELRDLDDPPPDLFTGLQDAVDDGEEVPVDGEEVAIDGEEVAIDGEEVAIDGEEVAIDGEEVPSTEKRWPSTEKRWPSTEKRCPSTEKRCPSTEKRWPSTEKRWPSTEKRWPSTEKRRPSTEKRRPSTEKRRPSTEHMQSWTKTMEPPTERMRSSMA